MEETPKSGLLSSILASTIVTREKPKQPTMLDNVLASAVCFVNDEEGIPDISGWTKCVNDSAYAAPTLGPSEGLYQYQLPILVTN